MAMMAGKIRGSGVVGTKPAHSWINQAHLHDVLGRLDCLSCRTCTTTPNRVRADIVLPAAGWGEKEGNVHQFRAALRRHQTSLPRPGQRSPTFTFFSWWRGLGCADLFRNWTFARGGVPASQELSKGLCVRHHGHRGYPTLDRAGGIQWPLREGEKLDARTTTLRRWSLSSRTTAKPSSLRPSRGLCPSRPARAIHSCSSRGGAARANGTPRRAPSGLPFSASSHQGALRGDSPPTRVALGIQPKRRRSDLAARDRHAAFVTSCVRPGEVFMPMHYETMNQLTSLRSTPTAPACLQGLRRPDHKKREAHNRTDGFWPAKTAPPARPEDA